ncbi:hypothetical protein ACSBR2_011370 [Camellia fascicularis]
MANGGWIPVVHQWRGGGSKRRVSWSGLSTVFVDNLSSSMDAKSLYKLFTKFGIVNDVYIPFKRRKVTNTRFGFVRYDCHVASNIAIQKANGLLVDDRVLAVKYATHERNARAVQSRGRPQTNKEALGAHDGKCTLPFTGHKSFAEVLKGDARSRTGSVPTTIKVNDDGHGWLHDSVIIRLHSDYTIHSIRKALKEKGLHQVVVREGGGCDIILTFHSQEELKSNIQSIKEWFQAWSLFVLEWNPAAHIQQERCAWLKCHGIPLHLWNRNTLNSIGSLWGTILHLEGDICCPDSFSFYRIKITTSAVRRRLPSSQPWEIAALSSNSARYWKTLQAEECFKGEEGEAEVAARCDLSCAGASLNEVARRMKPCHGLNEEDVDTRVEESSCDVVSSRPSVVGEGEAMIEERAPSPKCNDKSARCVEQASIAGLFKSHSGPKMNLGPGISLEVDLGLPLCKHCVQSPTEVQNARPTPNDLMLLNSPGPHTGVTSSGLKILSLKDQGQVNSPSFYLNHLRNTRNSGRKKPQMEGFSRFARLSAFSKSNSKPVIFRPAVAALAQSDLSKGCSSHRSFLLKETAATVQLGHKLGINFQGKEDVVMHKIIDLELNDKARIIKEGKTKIGFGKPEKRGRIKKLLKDRHIDVAFFQETNKVVMLDSVARGLWGNRDMEFLSVDPVGSAGGLLCIWDPGVFQLSGSCCKRRFILLSGTLYNSFHCVLLNIYAPNEVTSRSTFWNALLNLKVHFPFPWCLGGDFNKIRHMGERVGCSRRDRGMKHLNEFIEAYELNDLPLYGRKYTWCNNQDAQKWSRIDRVLLSPEWLIHFNMKLWGLPRLISDHCPLLLMEDDRDWGPKPFRFINAWTLHPSFSNFFTTLFGNVSSKLKAAEDELHALDITAEDRELLASEKGRRREVRTEVWNLYRRVEWLWHQKSRLAWSLQGDKNTRYFHVFASSRHSRNMINSIPVDGVPCEDPSRVKQEVLRHFSTQFMES